MTTEKLGGGVHLVLARHGFMADPKLDSVLTLARDQGLEVDSSSASFFLGHENLVAEESGALARWRAQLFIFMAGNAANASSFFSLPADRVIEVGVRLEI